MRILEVNNIDLIGRRFNGYDLQQMINRDTSHLASQIVIHKSSTDPNVATFHPHLPMVEGELTGLEARFLGIHSQLSLTDNLLVNHPHFQQADVVHYHLIHNTKLSLTKLVDLCRQKPSIFSIHDPWFFTGHCVQPHECGKWRTGCHHCPFLNQTFALTQDHSHILWELKKKTYQQLDADLIVTTPYMKKFADESPLTQHFKRIHLIPFGIDLKKFDQILTKTQARAKLKIPQDAIVIFFRSQQQLKGIEYIIEAFQTLPKKTITKKIVLLTCGERGHLKNLEDKYLIKELGQLGDDDRIVTAYNACDFFLMPSTGESFGLMAVEAMACARPVVIFNNTAMPSVTFAPECGVLVKNQDALALQKAIIELANNPAEMKKRGELGRKLALQHYDLNTYHKRMLAVYETASHRRVKPATVTVPIINYSGGDVQALLPLLGQAYTKLFHTKTLPKLINEHHYQDTLAKKLIDYSRQDVQDLLQQFNAILYHDFQQFWGMPLLSPAFFWCLWRSPSLFKIIISHRLRDHQKLLFVVKKTYYGFRKIYRLIKR